MQQKAASLILLFALFLERGIMNAKAENVFKICHLLKFHRTHSLNGVLRTNHSQPTPDIDEIIANAMMFDRKLLLSDKRAIRGIIAGYMDSKEK
ncbi:MAG: hypothetical protein ACLUAO_04140 [Streptococcus sp.]